jgi:hypothetical protein
VVQGNTHVIGLPSVVLLVALVHREAREAIKNPQADIRHEKMRLANFRLEQLRIGTLRTKLDNQILELSPKSSPKRKKPVSILETGFLAEEEGFEPPDLLQSAVFKTAAIDHSATPLGLVATLKLTTKKLSKRRKAFCREGGSRTLTSFSSLDWSKVVQKPLFNQID